MTKLKEKKTINNKTTEARFSLDTMIYQQQQQKNVSSNE